MSSSLPRTWFNRNHKRSNESEIAAPVKSHMNANMHPNMNGGVNANLSANMAANVNLNNLSNMSIENLRSLNSSNDWYKFMAENGGYKQTIDSFASASQNLSTHRSGPMNGPPLPAEWYPGQNVNGSMPAAAPTPSPGETPNFVQQQQYENTVSSAISLLSIKSSLSNGSFPSLPKDWMQQQAQQAPQHQHVATPQQHTQASTHPNVRMEDNFPLAAVSALKISKNHGSPQIDWNANSFQAMPNMVQASAMYPNSQTTGGAQNGTVQNEIPQVKNELSQARDLQVKQGGTSRSEEKQGGTVIAAPEAPGGNSRWNSWSHDEEVFLVAAVFDRLYRRGSLASSTKGENKDCWTNIKVFYDKVWEKHSSGAISQHVERSTTALSRHYKIMKERASQAEKSGHQQLYFKVFLEEWECSYNKNNRLINPSDVPL